MLIEHYELDVFTPPCDPGAERYSAKALLVTDIVELLPYLNATLPGAFYHREARALTWKKGSHHVAFHAREIAVSNVLDRQTAETELDELIALANRTWARRAEIEPSHVSRQRPVPMALLRLLPQTNCRACGEPTCFTFALKLAAAQRAPADCPPLLEAQYAEQRAALEAMLPAAPVGGWPG